jgi:hypothetical protein
VERTKELMNTNVLDSLVSDYQHLIPVIELPDDLLVQQFHLSEARVIDSARKDRARLRNPTYSADKYLMTSDGECGGGGWRG